MSGFGIPLLQIFTSDPSIPGSSPVGYIMTDHNRQPLQISYDVIETSNRMANGTMRRFITANKKKLQISWSGVPAAGGYNFTADANLGAAWLKSFYEENIYNPVWIKLTYAEEGWRFAGKQTVAYNDRYSSTNQTFNSTNLNANTGIGSSYIISNKSFSTFSASSGSATLTTKIPHNITTGAEIYVTGVDQVFNGTWIVASTTSNSLTYIFSQSNNFPARFNINSYSQTGQTATFNVDNSSFIQNNATFVIDGSKNTSGSSINGLWRVTSTPTSQNSFTASWAGGSQTARGQYGTATLISSASYSSTVSTLNPAIVGPAISPDVIKVFITNFTYNVIKRLTTTDYVDMSIDFTEI
jgi:hypothetical protein